MKTVATVARFGRTMADIKRWRKLFGEGERCGEFVYFIQDDEGRVKIGCSNNPRRRLHELQSSPERHCSETRRKLSLVGQTHGGKGVERLLHLSFAEFRIWCEWFAPNPELLALIAEAAIRPSFTEDA